MRALRPSRLVAVFLIVGLASAAVGLGSSLASRAERRASPNPIQRENALHGDDGWLRAAATDRAIEGYATEPSVQPGDTIHFHVSTTPAASYHLDVYRLGWYGGLGARLVACLPTCSSDDSGRSYGVPAWDVNGEVNAGWPVTDQLTVPSSWVSGYYLVDYVLTSGPQAGRAAVGYVIVRNPPSAQSAILVQVPVDTWQAYNAWGGRSLYDDQSVDGRRATYVSFERPYRWEPLPGGQPLEWEYPLVRFLEREGYDVSYQTDVDTDANPGSLLQHRLVITAGHGEYWSKTTRDAFDAARDQGVNLAFLGANTGYWQIKYADDRQTIVAYKSTYDPEPDPALKTAMFRALVPPRDECALLGIQFQASRLNFPPGDYTMQPGATGDPWLDGTGFKAGDVVKGIVSVETDTIPGTQTADSSCGHKLTVFFHLDRGGDQAGNADAVRYTADSGARVFASGSMTFAWGLDDYPPNPNETQGLVDPRLQRFMENAFNDLSAPKGPPPVVLTASTVRMTRARAGKPFSAAITVWNNGQPVAGTVGCAAKLGRVTLRAVSRSSSADGQAKCTWRLPRSGHGKRLRGSIGVSYQGSRLSRPFTVGVR